eukprot:UN10669
MVSFLFVIGADTYYIPYSLCRFMPHHTMLFCVCQYFLTKST